MSSRATIGNKTFEFQQVLTEDYAKSIAISKTGRRTCDVFLMQYVNYKSFEIALGAPVTKEFCIQYKTHYLGFGSYRWYQNTARELILKAWTGHTTANPELHLFDESQPGNKSPKYAFKHFHNCDAWGNKVEDQPPTSVSQFLRLTILDAQQRRSRRNPS